jgi:hypothetical protein
VSPASDGDQTPEKEPATPRADGHLAPGRIAGAIVFALIAVAFIVFGVMFMLIPSSDLPGFMGPVPGSRTHHTLRAVGSALVGLVFIAAAWFALRYQSLALEQARAADAAALAAESSSAESSSAEPAAMVAEPESTAAAREA